MAGEDGSAEPNAAEMAPVAARHHLLLHFLGNALWSDGRTLAWMRNLLLPTIERDGPIEAWIAYRFISFAAILWATVDLGHRPKRRPAKAGRFSNAFKGPIAPQSRSISQTPRPYVAIRMNRPSGETYSLRTETFGSPGPNSDQLLPPSRVIERLAGRVGVLDWRDSAPAVLNPVKRRYNDAKRPPLNALFLRTAPND